MDNIAFLFSITLHDFSLSDLIVLVLGGEEEGRVVKRPRAPSAPDPDVDVAPGDQALDERNGPPKQPSVPPGFLSPSVKEYLELGKSIPGKSQTSKSLFRTTPLYYKPQYSTVC